MFSFDLDISDIVLPFAASALQEYFEISKLVSAEQLVGSAIERTNNATRKSGIILCSLFIILFSFELIIKKCAAPNETTHEKCRASFAATHTY